ncbi:MAG: Dph6-related ATP pyrophosphatase [Candidatus Dormibacteria bacterium]
MTSREDGGRHALMWSGGKDSALALQRALRSGLRVDLLLTYCSPESGRVRFHETSVELIERQAAALGITSRVRAINWGAMDDEFQMDLQVLRAEGFTGVILGNIHLTDVREWYESRVVAQGLSHVEPIWGDNPARLLHEYVSTGGRAVVTCADVERLGPGWLGRVTDEDFERDILAAGVDPCGEFGEYHTFAFAGPPFRVPVAWRVGESLSDGNYLSTPVSSPALTGVQL